MSAFFARSGDLSNEPKCRPCTVTDTPPEVPIFPGCIAVGAGGTGAATIRVNYFTSVDAIYASVPKTRDAS